MIGKVIFESEEEAHKFVVSILKPYDLLCDAPKLKELLTAIKEKGYIRKSVIEEAEEMYHNQENGSIDDVWSFRRHLIEILYKAIQELKAENERLKCLKP